jgi:hypothetical protein
MEREEINLNHGALLEPKLRNLGTNFSNSFASFYLFRKVHALKIIQCRDLYIQGVTRDGVPFLMPTSPLSEVDWEELYSCMEAVEILFPIPEEGLHFFDPEKFEWSYEEMDDDYLYHTSKLAHLPGRHLSSRRNLLHQFLELYPKHEFLPLTKERIQSAQNVLEEWNRDPHGDLNFTDYEECKEALQLLDQLNLTGHIVTVEEEPAGFLIGERLNTKVQLFHFAKCSRRFKGIYQYLFEMAAQSVEGEVEWINLEEDIGSKDIRHAKRSYYPDLLLHKFRVRKRTGGKKIPPVPL